MIIEKPDFHFVYQGPSDLGAPYKGKFSMARTREEYLEHWGKWVILDTREKLDELAKKIDPYVEDRYIYNIKYDRAPLPFLDMGDVCVMMVFCDDRERERVWEILAKVGVTEKAWFYEWQTFDLWKPGGMLSEKFIDYYRLSPEEGEKFAKEIQQRFEEWLSFVCKKDKAYGYDGIWNFEEMQIQRRAADKINLINGILKIEWNMFSTIQNIGGKAQCQEDPKTFEIMRSSQFVNWSYYSLESYLNDLKKAGGEKRNLLAEKYARMMKSNSPLEYARIEHSLPKICPEAVKIVNKIIAIEIEWHKEFSKKFPYISGRGRPIYSRQDTPIAVSVETYLRGELETYSLNTLELYYKDVLDRQSSNTSGSELVHDYQVKRHGYKSLEDAERVLRESNNGIC